MSKHLTMRVLLICLILSVVGAPLPAAVLEVPSQEYPTIQSAIRAGETHDVVRVAPGTYYENLDFLGKAITVQSWDPNNAELVACTILDGSRSVDPNFGSAVLFRCGEGRDSVLSGFTITGGSGSWIAVSWRFFAVYWNRCGGGVLCCNLSEPTISNNVFRGNLAGQGGGIYIYGDPVDPANPSDPAVHVAPLIYRNVFEYNSAVTNHGYAPPNDDYPVVDHGDGGAIVAFQGCDARIVGNTLRNNHADYYGGAIHLRQWSGGVIEDNTIADNSSLLGAGIHVTYNSHPAVRRNLIEGNRDGGLGGGGLYVYYYSDPLIERNVIRRNESANGGGLAIFWSSRPLVANNLIYRNMGSGIRIKGSNPEIAFNTLVGNTAGGVECFNGTAPYLHHNLISDNAGRYGIYVQSDSHPTIRYNNCWQNRPADYGTAGPSWTNRAGNISVAPRLADPDQDDYRLNYDSGCINAGDPNYLAAAETDFEGDPRRLGSAVDIGADEAWSVWDLTGGGRYETIQEALDAAESGAQIVLTPNRYRGPGNRDLDFAGKALTLRSIRPNDPQVQAATIIDSAGTLDDPHRGFLFHHGEGADSVLDGLTITGGAYAYEGGGIKCITASSPTISNCRIVDNRARDHGGGIYCGGQSNPWIENCEFRGNRLEPFGYGGGLYCSYSRPTIVNCRFIDNAAVGSGRHGGGICLWGTNDGPSDALVVNCAVSGNTAGHRGGGLYAYWSRPTFLNCTVIGNRSLEGGGVATFGRDYLPDRVANPKLINCIVRDNRAVYGMDLALINTLGVWGWPEHSEMTVCSSDVQGGQEEVFVDLDCVLHWGEGNFDADPNFTAAGRWLDQGTPADPNDDVHLAGNYHLTPGSACIDRGRYEQIFSQVTRDWDREARIVAAAVDVGADEFFRTAADLTGDGRVDMRDLAILKEEWLREGPDLRADLQADGGVDGRDYAELAAWWLWRGAWLDP